MQERQVEIVQMEERCFYGLWKQSGDRTVAQDIRALSSAYRAAACCDTREALPYVVLCKDYNESTGAFSLFVGSTSAHEGLEMLALPAGTYARLQVRPKLGFLWGAAVGESKRSFYQSWLPTSDYEPLNLEYEYHTEKSLAKHPAIELIFALREKGR